MSNRIEYYLTFRTQEDKARLMDKLFAYKTSMGRGTTNPQALERALDTAMGAVQQQAVLSEKRVGGPKPPVGATDGVTK